MAGYRFLGVLLCYNDGDLLPDSLEYLLNCEHDLVVWDHGSNDDTPDILARYRRHLRECTRISREVDFYDLYPLMSKHLIRNYVSQYDWISWPDQDELLEGPTRIKPYSEYIAEACDSPYSWIRFRDFEFWFTEQDDPSVESTVRRVRHYALRTSGPQKVRSWRASATNIRHFNHNPALGVRYPKAFNLRHYPVRSARQLNKRFALDRANIRRGQMNYHYDNIRENLTRMQITAAKLHLDDGVSELDRSPAFDWSGLYGSAGAIPRLVSESSRLALYKWDIADVLMRALTQWKHARPSPALEPRLDKWVTALDRLPGSPSLVIVENTDSAIVTESLARDWTVCPDASGSAPAPRAAALPNISMTLGSPDSQGLATLELRTNTGVAPAPLVAALPILSQSLRQLQIICFEGDRASIELCPGHYIIAVEPSF